MDVSFDCVISPLDSSFAVQDAIDALLVDPNFSVSDMIEQYDVPAPAAHEKKTKKELFCAVCASRASGFNFDQITCESCKAFFRRNALKSLVSGCLHGEHCGQFGFVQANSHCRFDGHCQITLETRRRCSHCRLQKCFAVGMRKDWIRSAEEKKQRLGQSQSHRRRKLTQETSNISPVSHPALLTALAVLSSTDRTRLNNITHCFDQFSREPSSKLLSQLPKAPISLRLDEFYTRKKPVFVNLISYFKQLPELRDMDVDDQVALVKRNIRLLIPINYTIIRAAIPHYVVPNLQTIGCVDNANLHAMFRRMGDFFMDFAEYDNMLLKLFLSVLFFTTTSVTTRSVYDPGHYERLKEIKQAQTSYLELLWSYMMEKCGEEMTVHLLTKMVTRYLHVQLIVDQIDSIVQRSEDVHKIDALMQTILHLT